MSYNLNAQPRSVKGIVMDSVSGEGVAYATIYANGNKYGIMTNEEGKFEIELNENKDILSVSGLGFQKKKIAVERNDTNFLIINLQHEGITLDEVVVKKQKHKYSKKNNPAVDFVNKIRERRDLNNPRRHDFFNYNKYEKITLAINNFTELQKNGGLMGQFKFLNEYIDTSEVSGKPILNVSVKEKASQIIYRKEPETEKEYITGIKREGIDDLTDQESMQTFLEDIFREIDLYQNDINILQNRFVSPLSKIAPDFYKFYLTDTVEIGNERCIQLSFAPHNSSTFGFVGHIYVLDGDSTMFIKKINMKISPLINLNFIDHMYISQEYIRASDGSRLKTKDDMTMEISVLPGTQGLYARRNTTYSDHNFNKASNPYIYDDMRRSIISEDAYLKDNTFWNNVRTSDITSKEQNVGSLLTQLRSVPIYYWGEKFLRILVSGYVHTAKDSKIDIGPVNTFLSYNDIEGYRIKIGGLTTANFNENVFARGYVAYGTKDRKFKYNGEVEYSFNKKKYHSREFPIHSIKFAHLYDVNQLGQQYSFTNKDNFFLSLKRHEDTQMTYLRKSNIEYTLELYNNLSIIAGVSQERQESTFFMPFINGNGISYSHYNETLVNLKLRYAPGEKFYQTKSHRVPINLDAPIIELTHTYAPKGVAGNMFEINKTELSAQKRFWLSAFGFIDVILKGGHVWSSSPYPNLLIPNANLSYTIQPESFALMNPMEFVNDSYVSWDFTYWANGVVLNYIPLVKKLKLREAFSFRGIYGHLSDRNDPQKNVNLFEFPMSSNTQRLTSTPYMEAGVGIDNLFKVLRVDYVWRLSYRKFSNIDKSGVRIALHVTF